jgi:hypothetical protein
MPARALPKTILLSVCSSALSLAAGASALLLAEFGAPVWVFAGLLAWLVTLGLPTLVSVLLLARFWPGPSFGAFLVAAVLVSFLSQLAMVSGIRQARTRRRERLAR